MAWIRSIAKRAILGLGVERRADTSCYNMQRNLRSWFLQGSRVNGVHKVMNNMIKNKKS